MYCVFAMHGVLVTRYGRVRVEAGYSNRWNLNLIRQGVPTTVRYTVVRIAVRPGDIQI